jgi:H+/Cl- antiporter ClcA
MTAWSTRRLGALAGVVFVVLAVIATLVAGSIPDFNASPAKITSYYQDHHSRTLLAFILSGAAAPLFGWLVASIAVALRDLGQAAWAFVAFAGGIVGIALGAAADAVASTRTWRRRGTRGSCRASTRRRDS